MAVLQVRVQASDCAASGLLDRVACCSLELLGTPHARARMMRAQSVGTENGCVYFSLPPSSKTRLNFLSRVRTVSSSGRRRTRWPERLCF